MFKDLSGIWQCEIPGQRAFLRLPGTLDESGIGFPDDPCRQWKADEVRRIGFYRVGDPIVTRLTRKHTFEGKARISRTVDWNMPEGQRVFVDVERARQLQLQVNGQEAPLSAPASLSTPCCFEVTGLVTGRDEFVFLSDNSYPGWPRNAIVYSSAASDETQTNWNGLLGYMRLRTERQTFISGVRVYPHGQSLDVCVELDSADPWHGVLHVSSGVLENAASFPVEVLPGKHEIRFRGLAVKPETPQWNTGEGNLHVLTVSGPGLESVSASFGLRDFSAENGCFTLNGRRIFLRSEANCAVFPETGHPPMDADAWKEILLKYRAYGVNCMRFHSHCPPEAAFAAADELGLLMQPELSHWDPEHAFASEEAQRYYGTELRAILRYLANHPSFVMLTFGNELHADAAGHAFMDSLLSKARDDDPTRLYANGSNVHYGAIGADPASDFYTAMTYYDRDMRATCDGPKGWLNQEYPNARRNYDETMAALRQKTDQPVFSFEVGQYEVLPDFDEIYQYHGVTSPENLKHIQRKVHNKGMEKDWQRMAEATGESALLCYRAEAEAALRTEGYSGISLLGLQDFPGQGTALVGMMNAHLTKKPYDFARPDRFAAFFRDTLPLVLLEKYTYTTGETINARVRMANYGKNDLSGSPAWDLCGGLFDQHGMLHDTTAPAGHLTDLGKINVPLDNITKPQKLTLTVSFCGTRNTYSIWVYPDACPVCPDGVCECRSFDEKAEQTLQNGGIVYLAPDSTEEALPNSIQAQFSPDFWSVCTFPRQAGGMGQLIDTSHPIFRSFPTEAYNTWQWWPMAIQRAMILPEKIDCIIAEMDSFAFLRPMAKLFECKCGNGRLLVSSFGLHNLQQYPEARALQQAVYDYLGSNNFTPTQQLSETWIKTLFRAD